MLCKKTYKNQITLPKKVMENFEGIEYFEADVRDGKIVLDPVQIVSRGTETLEKARKRIEDLGLTEEEIKKAVAWARKGHRKG